MNGADYAGQSSGRTSSIGSSTRADFAKVGNKFHDEARLNAAVKLFSTLSGASNGDNQQGINLKSAIASITNQQTENTFEGKSKRNSSAGFNRHFFLSLERSVLKMFFRVNHVVLSQQAVTSFLYHCILALRALQMAFNIFYGQDIRNEFRVVNSHLSSAQLATTNATDSNFSTPGNSTSLSGISSGNNDLAGGDLLYDQVVSTFQLTEYLEFSNFHFYAMKPGTKEGEFVTIWAAINGSFVLFVLLLVSVSGRVFEASKNADLKETTKLLLKGLSIVMCLAINILPIPIISINLQGFKCFTETTTDLYAPAVQCGSVMSSMLILFSTVMLLFFLAFLLLQSMLYTSNSFDSVVPWGTFERTISFVRIFKALVLSIGFVFDLSGDYRGQINLVCATIQCTILYRRYKRGIIFNSTIYYASVIFEGLQSWLFITIAFHIIADSYLTVTSLVLIILSGLSLSGMLVYKLMASKDSAKVTDQIGGIGEPIDLMVYFYRFHKVIESESSTSEVIMQGKLRNHCQNCINPACICLTMLKTFDEATKLREILDAYKNDAKVEDDRQFSKSTNHFQQSFGNHQVEDIDAINVLAFSITNILDNDKIESPSKNKNNNGSLTINDISGIAMTGQDLNSQLLTNIGTTMVIAHSGAILPPSNEEGLGIIQPQQIQANQRASHHPIDAIGNPWNATMKQGGATQEDASIYANWLAKRRRMAQFEEGLNRIYENQIERETVRRFYYQLLALIVREAIERFPKCIDFRIINAYVQKEQLGNEFKAIFEMMNSELCNPTIFEKFVIFRKKLEVEETLIKSHQKNIQKIGCIDVALIFRYEKLFQRYQLYEYLATYSAQCFWRELLQKQTNAGILQEKGSLISKFYEQIQDLAKELILIYPNEIKFFFCYANFLLHIIHNEFDALEYYQLVQNIFQMRLTKKRNSNTTNEQAIFGENSAAAIVIISATSSKIGTIIHCNEEIENVLRYRRSELIGQNVNILIPRPIAKVHDRLVQRYFETAVPNVIEIKRQLFGVVKEGYLQEVELIVKVLPQVNEKIIFVGFIQRVDYFDDMEVPSTDYDRMDKQYIVTDQDGNITNVTEGLNFDLGLHSKFFNYTDSIFEQMFNIQSICPEIMDPNHADLLETEGKLLNFDTTAILANVELEQLTSDEILEVRSNLGRYQIYTQCKKLNISSFCTIHIYRLIIIGKYNGLNSQLNGLQLTALNKDSNLSDALLVQEGSASQDDTLGVNHNSVSSMSSASTGSFSFNRVIKDFKKALGERKTPRNLVILSRIVVLMIIGIIILSSVNYSSVNKETTKLHEGKEQNLLIESRSLKFVQLASNVRSLFNIANNLEFDTYSGTTLTAINRFDYLQNLIETQAEDLSNIHELISKKRFSSTASTDEDDYDREQSKFEYLPVEIFRLDNSNQVSNYEQPFRVAFLNYLNYILALNGTSSSMITLPEELLHRPIFEGEPFKINKTTTQLQKGMFFLIANGIRSLRDHSRDATTYFQASYFKEIQTNPFLAVMLIGIFMSLLTFGSIIFTIWQIERTKVQIMCLYTHLEMTEIDAVYNQCLNFMDNLNKGSMLAGLNEDQVPDTIEPVSQIGSGAYKAGDLQKGSASMADSFINVQQFGSGKITNPHGSMLSEEEKDEIEQKVLIEKKREQRLRDIKKSRTPQASGQEVYGVMLKKTYEKMRIITEKEEQSKNIGQQKNTVKRLRNTRGGEEGPQIEVAPLHENKKNRKISQEAAKSQQPTQKGQKNLIDAKGRRKANINGVFHRDEGLDSSHKFGSNQKQEKKPNFPKKQNQDEIIDKSKKAKKHRKKEDDECSEDEESDADNTVDRLQPPDVDVSNEHEEEERPRNVGSDKTVAIGGMQDQSSEEFHMRQTYFVKTIKNEQWGKVLTTLLVCLIFLAYFIQLYVYNGQFKSQISLIQDAIPMMLGRFRHHMLAFAILKERILLNNTMNWLDYNPTYGYALDIQKIEESIENERHITRLKLSHSSIIQGMVDFLSLADSESFCKEIVMVTSAVDIDSNVDPDLLDNVAISKVNAAKPYESLVQSVVQTQIAAMTGNVTYLKQLRAKNVNMDSLNYDKRTPLHFAAKAGSLEAVQYLTSIGAAINPVDRWGATPLTYGQQFPNIQAFLKSVGGVLGTDTENFKVLESVYATKILTEDQYRAFYAAYFDDLESLKILNMQNKLNVNAQDQDGRSALAIAAAEGSLMAIKYLLYQGADVAVRDARFHNAVYYAKIENYASVVDFLEAKLNEKTIFNYCSEFQAGLLSKGLQQAVGNFHKRFADIQIKLERPAITRPELQELLGQGITTISTNEMFYSTQELYYSSVIDKTIDKIQSVFNEYLDTYSTTTETVFVMFLCFQIVMLYYLRDRLLGVMREDVFQSRGILNLIPDSFFEMHRSKVEKLIKNLKD